jgi:hypothetical protein
MSLICPVDARKAILNFWVFREVRVGHGVFGTGHHIDNPRVKVAAKVEYG